MQVDGNAAAVVLDGHRIVCVDRNDDAIGVTGERFINGVVDDLVHHVMQPGDVIGVADIHALTLANGIESLEYFDVFCGVVLCHPVVSLTAVLGGVSSVGIVRGFHRDLER